VGSADSTIGRHEAIHAIGSVLSEKRFGLMMSEPGRGDLNADYMEKL
jgi:hypothetical protein